MNIQVSKKIAYGQERFYPENDHAKAIIELIGRPSLTRRQLEVCKKLGFKIYKESQNEKDELFEE